MESKLHDNNVEIMCPGNNLCIQHSYGWQPAGFVAWNLTLYKCNAKE